MRHRYASPLLQMTDDKILVKQIIELEEGEFKQNYPFEKELPATVWVDGLIEIVEEKGKLIAYNLSPYDCINRQSVAETQHIRLT